MLAFDFHIMNIKISMGYWKIKNTMQISWCATSHIFFLILWSITNQTISQNIEKYSNSDTKNTFTRKYMNRST